MANTKPDVESLRAQVSADDLVFASSVLQLSQRNQMPKREQAVISKVVELLRAMAEDACSKNS